MVTVLHESQRVSVPGWVTDINAFRRWTDANDFPDKARIWWLKGEVWIDMSKEQIFTHVRVKTEVTPSSREYREVGAGWPLPYRWCSS